MVEGLASQAEAEDVARSIRAVVEAPIERAPVMPRARFGMALTAHRCSVEALLERADFAMHRAALAAHEETEPDGATPDLELPSADGKPSPTKARLEQAIERREFRLVYQPRLSLSQEKLTGVEALLRWEDPERGLLRPAQFIEHLEDADLMLEVNDWVVSEVALQAQRWRQEGLLSLRLSVNLAARQFDLADFADHLTGVISAHGAEASWFELDCSESLLMSNPARSRMVLKALQAAGFRTAIDISERVLVRWRNSRVCPSTSSN